MPGQCSNFLPLFYNPGAFRSYKMGTLARNGLTEYFLKTLLIPTLFWIGRHQKYPVKSFQLLISYSFSNVYGYHYFQYQITELEVRPTFFF